MKKYRIIADILYAVGAICDVIALGSIAYNGPSFTYCLFICIGAALIGCGSIWQRKYKQCEDQSQTKDDKQGEK